MGMLLMMAIILAGASIWVEVKLVNGIPTIKKLNRNGVHLNNKDKPLPVIGGALPSVNIDGSAVGIVMSIVLSIVLGTVFGAAGLVVMVAGLLSTAVTEPFWGVKRAQEKRAAEGKQMGPKLKGAVQDFNLLVGRPVARTTKAAARPANKGIVYMHKYLREVAVKREQLYKLREDQRKQAS